jgi:hypothetical protein
MLIIKGPSVDQLCHNLRGRGHRLPDAPSNAGAVEIPLIHGKWITVLAGVPYTVLEALLYLWTSKYISRSRIRCRTFFLFFFPVKPSPTHLGNALPDASPRASSPAPPDCLNTRLCVQSDSLTACADRQEFSANSVRYSDALIKSPSSGNCGRGLSFCFVHNHTGCNLWSASPLPTYTSVPRAAFSLPATHSAMLPLRAACRVQAGTPPDGGSLVSISFPTDSPACEVSSC